MALPQKKLMTLMFALGLMTILLVSSAYAQTTDALLTVQSTIDSAVVVVSGMGFDPLQPVTLNIYRVDGSPLGSFEGPTTDSDGSFAFNLTLPYIGETNIYTFQANTSTVSGVTQHVLFSQANPTPTPAPTGAATVTVSPDSGNIFNVTGTFFDASRKVSFKLTNAAGLPAFIFSDNVTTDGQGRFSAILIVPTTISGTFNLVASTSTKYTGNDTVTVPNLQGPAGTTGPSGEPGASGAPGASGEPGTAGAAGSGSDLGYIGIALGVVAIVMAGFALVKSRRAAVAPETKKTEEKI